jgi:hypothetical protein
LSQDKSISKVSTQRLKISNLDKKAIILSILNRTDGGKPNIKAYKFSETAYISTINLPEPFVKEFYVKDFRIIKGVKTKFILSNEIQNKLKINFDYLEFSEFEISKYKVLVSIKWFFAGGGDETKTYEYQKIKGKWKGEQVGGGFTTPPEFGTPSGGGIILPPPPPPIKNQY